MIRVKDLAYVRFRVPDLDVAEQFMLDFGLSIASRTDSALYMRGTDPDPFLYVAERHEQAGFIGPAFEVETEADLHKVATLAEASDVEDNPSHGGGKRVRLIDPDGYQIEFVHGATPSEPLPAREALRYNVGNSPTRLGEFQRPEQGPAHVRRIGHLILRVRDYPKALEYYSQFGFMVSDEVHAEGEPDNPITGFLKCNHGDDYTDHHTLGLAVRHPLALDHIAFECIDFDDVVLGGNHLTERGYTRSWGVGRHILGSQVFDYWRDPHGFKVEHWTDGDQVNVHTEGRRVEIGDDGPGAISQWGPPTEDFRKVYPGATSIGPVDE